MFLRLLNPDCSTYQSTLALFHASGQNLTATKSDSRQDYWMVQALSELSPVFRDPYVEEQESLLCCARWLGPPVL